MIMVKKNKIEKNYPLFYKVSKDIFPLQDPTLNDMVLQTHIHICVEPLKQSSPSINREWLS